jgi:hypothetical protein
VKSFGARSDSSIRRDNMMADCRSKQGLLGVVGLYNTLSMGQSVRRQQTLIWEAFADLAGISHVN